MTILIVGTFVFLAYILVSVGIFLTLFSLGAFGAILAFAWALFAGASAYTIIDETMDSILRFLDKLFKTKD
jgi:hypothetical protein